MKRLLFIFCIILGFGGVVRSQNLVPNHDFSQRKDCSIPGYTDINTFFHNWFTPAVGLGDSIHNTSVIFHRCRSVLPFGYDTAFYGGGCPSRISYNPYPKEGLGYLGFFLLDTVQDSRSWYYPSPGCSNNYLKYINNFTYTRGRTFAEVQLSGSLTANEEYVVEFYTQHNSFPRVYYTSNIAALLTPDTFYHFDYFKNPITPTIEANSIIYNEFEWVRIKGSFIAQGNEQFLTLGNFRTDLNSTYHMALADTSYGNSHEYHYFIDAVYLYKATDTLFDVNLPADTTICTGDSIWLHAWHDDGFKLEDTVKTFEWSTGSTDSSIVITQPGAYWVKVEYNHRFWQSDTIYVHPMVPPYTSSLDSLVEGCKDDPVTLRARPDVFRELYWSTGEKGNSITVSDSGYYRLFAASTCDTVTDSVLVSLINCDTLEQQKNVYIPNSFSPNGDGINDTWEIPGLPEDNEVVIFNRWGNLIYQKTGYAGDWNGTDTQGNLVPEGIYVFKISYTIPPGITEKEFGWINVLRR